MKIRAVLLLIVIAAVSFAACKRNENTATPKTFDLTEIQKTVMEILADNEPVSVPTEGIIALYDLDEKDIRTAACITTLGGDGAFPDEIVMVEAADENAALRIEEKLNARLADVTAQAQNCDRESFALFQLCRVERSESYVNLFISPAAAQLHNAFVAAGK